MEMEYHNQLKAIAIQNARKERLKGVIISSMGPNGRRSTGHGNPARKDIALQRLPIIEARSPYPQLRGRVRIG